MDRLPDSLLLQILSQLDDSADVARCRVAYKPFNTVSPDIRSFNLQCSEKWYINSTSSTVSTSENNKALKAVFVELISKMKSVESVRIGHESVMLAMSHGVDRETDDFYLIDEVFAKQWLPMVSQSLKSLSLYGLPQHRDRRSNVLSLISMYCHNLVKLKLKFAWLCVDNLNPMPMLTNLTLALTN